MSRFDMDRAHEAMEAARVERARLVVASFAHVFERIATFLREMASRDLPDSQSPAHG